MNIDEILKYRTPKGIYYWAMEIVRWQISQYNSKSEQDKEKIKSLCDAFCALHELSIGKWAFDPQKVKEWFKRWRTKGHEEGYAKAILNVLEVVDEVEFNSMAQIDPIWEDMFIELKKKIRTLESKQ